MNDLFVDLVHIVLLIFMTEFTGFTSSFGIGIACVGVFGSMGLSGFKSPSDIGILLTFEFDLILMIV